MLNNTNDYNLTNTLNIYLGNDPETNPYLNNDKTLGYCSINHLVQNLKNPNDPLFLSINIQSLNSKYEKLIEFINELTRLKLNIVSIALQEVWAVPYPDFLKIPHFELILKQRDRGRGGGVGFYIRNDLPKKIINNLSPFIEGVLECLTVEITLSKKKILLTSFYRPPNNSKIATDEFLLNFENLLNTLDRNDFPYFIFGDANINLLKINNCSIAQRYWELFHNNGFTNSIFRASRIQDLTYSLIDHILCRNEPVNTSAGVIPYDLSDHFFTFLTFSLEKTRFVQKITKYRDFSIDNLNQFKLAINSISWDFVLAQNDTNLAFNEFFSIFSDLYELYFPVKTKKLNRNTTPLEDFMTQGLLISRARKEQLHYYYLRNRNIENFNKFKQYRNIYNSLIRTSKKLTLENKLLMNKKKPKKIWEIYNNITVGKNNKSNTFEINIDGNITDDKNLIAENFNDFFSTIGSQISNSIPQTDRKPEVYFNNEQAPLLKFEHISPGEVLAVIKTLEPKNSTDIYGFSSKLIKFVDTEICTPLAHIFNISVKDGIFPDKLKSSRVVPVFKNGDQREVNNYRPISLIPSFAKIIEKIISYKLINHLEINNLLTANQFGFQRKLSTEHCLTHLTNYVSDAINENKYAIGVFLDLQKAFDVVSHEILLKKLSNLGIKDSALKWFESYLSNRVQCVDISGHLSNSKIINISVMQGSVLGPLLFLCFINDLPNASELLKLLLFADDTCALDSDTDLPKLINRVNTELQRISDWFITNRIAVNVSKCKFIIFHSRGKVVPNNIPQLCFKSINNVASPLERIHRNNPNNNSYKYLGVLIDENLNLNSHIDYVCKKLSRALYCLNRVKHKLGSKALRTLYFALFHPHLLYCILILNCASVSNLNKIQILQKKAIRTITNSKYNAHTAPLFLALNILPFDKLLYLNNAQFMHQIYHKYHHKSFDNTWQRNIQRNLDHNLRNLDHFYLPYPRIEQFKRSPLYALAKLWNTLPNEDKAQTNKFTFSSQIKNSLFRSVANEMDA